MAAGSVATRSVATRTAASAAPAAGLNPLAVHSPEAIRAPQRSDSEPTAAPATPQLLAGAAAGGPPTRVAVLAAPEPRNGRGARIGGRSLNALEGAAPPARPLPAGLVAAGLGLLLAGLTWRMAKLVRRW